MPPSSFVGLLLFIWLITPGFVFSYLAARRRPLQVESAFQEASRVVLASVLFSAVAALTVVGLNAVASPRVGLDLRRVVAGDVAYLRDRYVVVVIVLVIQVLGACGLAWLGDTIVKAAVANRSGQAAPKLRSESAWTRPLGLKPANASPHAWVRLKSGVEISGRVAAFNHDITVADRELVLSTPLHMRSGDGPAQALQWQLVIVQGTDIEMLAVKYVRDAPPSGSSPD